MNIERIKTYLRDMAELETRVFTLRQTVGQIQTKIQGIQHSREENLKKEIYDLEKEIVEEESKINDLVSKIHEAQESRRQAREKRDEEVNRISKTNSWMVIICVVLALFTCFVSCLILILYRLCYLNPLRKEWRRACASDSEYWSGIIQKYQTQIDESISKIADIRQRINQLKARQSNNSAEREEEKDFYTQQIQAIERHLQALTETRAKLYAFDIVPEEYRALDCLLYLHQVFKIELADNMKDAVRIYEQKIFSGDVIKGIQHIYAKLDDLSGQMPFVTMVLENVTEKVKELCQELCDVVQTDPTSTTEETKLNRYATQALQESNERLAWYEEQRRLGLL